MSIDFKMALPLHTQTHAHYLLPRLASRIEVKSGDDPLCHPHNRTEETVFQFKHVPVKRTVLEYIQNRKQGAPAGPDKIPTAILKHAADFICKPILGTFPNRWKIARITPIYKSDSNNFAMTSYTSFGAKQ